MNVSGQDFPIRSLRPAALLSRTFSVFCSKTHSFLFLKTTHLVEKQKDNAIDSQHPIPPKNGYYTPVMGFSLQKLSKDSSETPYYTTAKEMFQIPVVY